MSAKAWNVWKEEKYGFKGKLLPSILFAYSFISEHYPFLFYFFLLAPLIESR